MGEGGAFKIEYGKGYFFALLAAFSWPLYSLTKKRLPLVPLRTIGGFCIGAGVLSLITHFWLEPRVVLQWPDAWKILLMGLGPFGLAFYTWDLAMTKGDGRLLGALAYLTPVLSTTGLVFFTDQELSSSTILAMLLIIGGASSGLLDFLPVNILKKGRNF
jgi:drug/metabolite transporter (DMT)-like permease